MIKIYVDGSFNTTLRRAGWGFCVVEDDNVIHEDCGITEYIAESRNIDGECEAAYRGIKYANENNLTATIAHDYTGISKWALGEWKAKKDVSKRYKRRCKRALDLTNITFEWIKGHSGNRFNERADKLADKGKKILE